MAVILYSATWQRCAILLRNGDNKSAFPSSLCVLIACCPKLPIMPFWCWITQTGSGLIPISYPNTQQLNDEEKLVIFRQVTRQAIGRKGKWPGYELCTLALSGRQQRPTWSVASYEPPVMRRTLIKVSFMHIPSRDTGHKWQSRRAAQWSPTRIARKKEEIKKMKVRRKYLHLTSPERLACHWVDINGEWPRAMEWEIASWSANKIAEKETLCLWGGFNVSTWSSKTETWIGTWGE